MSASPVLFIAEAGVNHNGSVDMALQLVDAAAAAGADVVKFQTFRAASLASRHAPKAGYQARATGAEQSQLEMLQGLELDDAAHERLVDRCAERGIEFLSTPFDAASFVLLTQRLRLGRLKIGSGDLTNAPLLLEVARWGGRLILSTGMSTLAEVEEALAVLAYGYTKPQEAPPSRQAFRTAFESEAGQAALRERVSLLHCTTQYPTPFEDVNLRAMDTLAGAFGLPVGYSDHTTGGAISLAAVARGACVIEKHFTLDRKLPGPDHEASLEPPELAALVRDVRAVAGALGDGVKRAAASERANRNVARKSLVAARAIARGELFSAENLTVKRPGGGAAPVLYWDLLGRAAARDYAEDEVLDA